MPHTNLTPWQADRHYTGPMITPHQFDLRLDARYITDLDVGDWAGMLSARPTFDADGGCFVPGAGYQRWTIIEHEQHAHRVSELHQPAIAATGPFRCARCTGCDAPAFARCPSAQWAHTIRELSILLRGSAMFLMAITLTGHEYGGAPAAVTARTGRHVTCARAARGAGEPADLVVLCDGSILDPHGNRLVRCHADAVRNLTNTMLAEHVALAAPLRPRRRPPWFAVGPPLCHGCIRAHSSWLHYRSCPVREWACAWRNAPAWLLACIGNPCTTWTPPEDARRLVDAAACTSRLPEPQTRNRR